MAEENSTDPQPPAESEVAPPAQPDKLVRVKAIAIKGLKATTVFLEKSALYLFMVFLPLVITGYPAYLIVRDLAQDANAITVEATLTNIDINKVADDASGFPLFNSKGHTDVTLVFKGVDGRKYSAVIEMPWTAPGLRKQMDAKYGDRESFTLYLSQNGTTQIDEQVAGNRMTLLSLLMGLVLLASVLAIFLRHRLADRMPSLVTHESAANSRSIIYGQLMALVVTFVFTVIMHYTPVVVSNLMFLGVYWSVAILLGISLRLLVFQNPPPPPEPEEKPRERGLH